MQNGKTFPRRDKCDCIFPSLHMILLIFHSVVFNHSKNSRAASPGPTPNPLKLAEVDVLQGTAQPHSLHLYKELQVCTLARTPLPHVLLCTYTQRPMPPSPREPRSSANVPPLGPWNRFKEDLLLPSCPLLSLLVNLKESWQFILKCVPMKNSCVHPSL